MAEALAADIKENILTCSICRDGYEDPRVLPCYHTFCFGCISDHITCTLTPNQTFHCPVCKFATRLPAGGLTQLTKNFVFCRTKDIITLQLNRQTLREEQANVAAVTPAITQKTISCEKHPNNELKYYCEDEDIVVCGDCALTDHYRHGIVPVDKLAKCNRDKITAALENTMKTTNRFKVTRENINETDSIDSTNNSQLIITTVHDIEAHAQRIVQEITERKDTLISDFCLYKKQELINKESLQVHHTSLQSACDFAQQLVINGTDTEIMAHAKSLIKRLEAMEKMSVPTLDTLAQVSFSRGGISAAGLEAMLGQVTVQSQLPLDGQETNQRSTPHPPVFLDTAKCVHSFSSKLKDDTDIYIFGLAMDEVQVVVADNENNRAKTFTHGGKFEFDIKLDRPFDVTLSQTGHLYLTSGGDKCIQVYSAKGHKVTTMGEGQLDTPLGITLNRQGHVMVCDGEEKFIFTFHPDSGELLNTIPLSMCEYPRYITVSCVNDNIVISDWWEHCVHVLSPTGDQLYQYGTEGSGDGQLAAPCGVCTDRYGHIFIADCNNHRIVALSPRGKFIRYIATEEDGLESPKALTISPAGMLVVAEADGKVKKFQYLQ